MPTYRFTAAPWLWRENESWVFVTVPPHISDEIEGRTAAALRRGFGSVRVQATIGATTWRTSVFPDKGQAAYVLPLKKDVRAKEGIEVGTKAKVILELLDG